MSTITIETSEHRVADVNADAHEQFPVVVTIDGEPVRIINDDAFDAVVNLCDIITATATDQSTVTSVEIARVVDTMRSILIARNVSIPNN